MRNRKWGLLTLALTAALLTACQNTTVTIDRTPEYTLKTDKWECTEHKTIVSKPNGVIQTTTFCIEYRMKGIN